MRAFIDSDVLIGHLSGERNAPKFLRTLRDGGEYELWTGAFQRAEVVFFMRQNEEDSTQLFLSQFKTAPIDQAVVDLARLLYRQWNPSHGINVNDAFLAATGMLSGGQIFCLNTRHYPMPEVTAKQAW